MQAPLLWLCFIQSHESCFFFQHMKVTLMHGFCKRGTTMGKVLIMHIINIIICYNETFHETRLSATNRQKKRLNTFCRPFYQYIHNTYINLIRQQQSM